MLVLDALVGFDHFNLSGLHESGRDLEACDMIRTALNRTTLVLSACLGASSGQAAERSVLPLPIHRFAHVGPASAVVASVDTFPLTLLANLEFSYAGAMDFGDTDHDGAIELVFGGGSLNSWRIWEYRGHNTYALEDSGTSDLIPYAVGDLDQDGQSEIIGQTSGYVQVFESVNASSHPSQLVWSSPYLSNVGGYTTIGDTDRDGRMEIIQSVNGNGSTSGLAIFENTGDNTLTSVFNGTLAGPSATGEKLIADLDGDGKLEIALCGSPGWLHVFESPADNTWVLTFRGWTGLYNAYTIAGGQDTDGNGNPEIFVTGTRFANSTAYYCTIIYESTGDNTFAAVDTLIADEGVGSGASAVCNVDAVGKDEFLFRAGGTGIRVFGASTIGKWDWVAMAYGPGGGVHTFDLNGNGIPEVIWQYFTTRVFEYPGTITDTAFAWQPNTLDIVPNPCRGQATLRLTRGAETAARLAVFDARGRMVERRSIEPSGRSIVWRSQDLPAGQYFVRLEDLRGRVLAGGRGTIVH